MLMRSGLAGALGDRMGCSQEKSFQFSGKFKYNKMSPKQSIMEC